MFNNKRYLTRGVQADIPFELQFFMWECIDNLSVEKDYFNYVLSRMNEKFGVDICQLLKQVQNLLLQW